MLSAAAGCATTEAIEGARVFTHVWLAMVGRWDWESLPVVPPELVFLPASWPLSIWSFACWARQTIVALSVIMAHRPSAAFALRASTSCAATGGRAAGRPARIGLGFLAARQGPPPLRGAPRQLVAQAVLAQGAALREAERWIVARQEADGSWGGIQPPMVYSTIALVLQGYPLDHPVVSPRL